MSKNTDWGSEWGWQRSRRFTLMLNDKEHGALQLLARDERANMSTYLRKLIRGEYRRLTAIPERQDQLWYAQDEKYRPYQKLLEAIWGLEEIQFEDKDAGVEAMEKMLGMLSDAQRYVIRHRFGIGAPKGTLEEVGRGLHVTREWVRQVETKALRRLRSPMLRRRIIEYVDKGTWYNHDDYARMQEELRSVKMDLHERDNRIKELETEVAGLRVYINAYEAHKKSLKDARDILRGRPGDLETLGIGVRIYNSLKRAGIRDIPSLILALEDEDAMLSIPNFGEISLAEVKQKLRELEKGADNE